MTVSKPDDIEIELVRRLCNDLTQDITHLADKDWLQTALVSHVARLTKLDEHKVRPIVEVWFPNT